MPQPPFPVNTRLVTQALLAPALLTPLLLTLPVAPGRAQEAAPPAAPRTTNVLERVDAILADSQGLQRGLNLARATGIRLNGGLGLYRPANCMYAGISDNSCLVSREEQGFVFRFSGGPPGWEQAQVPPTVETEILVSRDGRTVLDVIHNGPPRS